MRDDRGNLDSWETPDWHPDWDGAFTFDSLRSFAEALHRADLASKLTIIEEGYAHLDVYCGPTRVAMVYVNRGDDDRATPKFSVYAGDDDDEMHTEDVTAAVAFIRAHPTPLPDDPPD